MIDEIMIISMCLILLLGCILSLLLTNFYRNLIFASENISITNDPFFKQLKLKYESLYKFQLDFCNTNSFINKQLYKLKYMRLPLYLWDRLLLSLKFISAFIGSFYVYLTLNNGDSIDRLLPYIALTILTYMILSILTVYISSDLKKDILITNLQEYMENYLNPRLSAQFDKGVVHASTENLQKNTKDTEALSLLSEDNKNRKEGNSQYRQAASILSNDRALFKEAAKERDCDDTSCNTNNHSEEPSNIRKSNIQLSEEVIEKILMEYL